MLSTTVSDQNAKIWNVSTGGLIQTLKHENLKRRYEALNAVFSKDDKKLITGSREMGGRIWDVKTGELLDILPRPEGIDPGGDTYVSLSPDGWSVLVYSAFYSPRVWSLRSGQLLHVFKNDVEYLRKFSPRFKKGDIGSEDANFSHNNKFVINGGFHNLAQIWDIKTGKLIHTIKHGEICGKHNCHWVFSSAFSPDDEFILTASSDGTFKIWQTETGRLIYTISDTISNPEYSGYKKAGFSNNGKYIYTMTTCGTTVKLWNFMPNEYLNR